MQVWRNVSSFRRRARNAEIIEEKLRDEVKSKVVKRTYEQMGAMDEHVKALKEKAAREEAEEEAELVRLSEGWSRARAVQWERQLAAAMADNSSETSSMKSGATTVLRNNRSESCLPSRTYLDNTEVLHAQRPPSPLHYHDYGHISVRPRSKQQQLRNKAGGPCRPHYRQDFCGVYFPGPDGKQGPYGVSMVEPILMPPRCWDQVKQPPDRYSRDVAEMRPRTAEGRDRPLLKSPAEEMLTQHEQAKPKPSVRTTRAHRAMVQRRKEAARKKDQEAFIESVRFEQGQYEGRFSNPLVKDSGLPNEKMIAAVDNIGAEPAADEYDGPRVAWDAKEPWESLGLAKHIFLGLHDVMRERRANLKHLFKYVNQGVPGILEPSDFLEGLQRLGILERGEVSAQQMADLMHDTDPNFDGRVALSHIYKCVAAAKARLMPAQTTRKNVKQEAMEVYSQWVPVETVAVDRQPKSLWDFECSFERLRKQQDALLVIHKEKDRKSPDPD
ncbi:unnamed protein product [Effrenium voratum]|uniref:Uncharacterized protein n=1 Tax=Effrenium voratum TaxID=2562239 RepID=A0AA36IP38_9DINO|nr:unnamed protein product [Effrenium voratum]CAJ1459133.1 unnamed protein product [Effrenium voratum]